MTAAEVAAQIAAWLDLALKRAQPGGGLRVHLNENDDTLTTFRAEAVGHWLQITIHQPNLSVFADLPVAAS